MAMTCTNGTRECDGCMECHPEPVVIGECAACGDDIHADEDRYYLPDGEMIHEDCLHDWAKQFRVSGT